MTLHPSERAYIIRTFGAYLCGAGELDLYWLPSKNRAAMRKTTDERRRIQSVDEDAIHVGRYKAPCPCDVYIGDLEAVLDTLAKPRPPLAGVEAQQVAAA